jgi:hypothetical protein
VHDPDDATDDELIEGIDTCHARVGDAQRAMFEFIARADRRELWRNAGARDMAHWICMRYGISHWKALRWIAAASALEELPSYLSGLRLRSALHRQGSPAHTVCLARDARPARGMGRGGLVCLHPA